MKSVVYAPVALLRFSEIFDYTVEQFGIAQAEAYAARLAGRLAALAAGQDRTARPCERLMRGVRQASGLAFVREGSHYLILRETPETLEVVEIFHERMNIEAHLERLAEGDPP